MTAIHSRRARQRGVTLIIVMILLVIVTVLGIGGARLALQSERTTRYDRDSQVAWQAAEAALVDAEKDISSSRGATFSASNTGSFVDGCSSSTDTLGMCATSTTTTPIWLSVDWTGSSTPTVKLGDKTGVSVMETGNGIQAARLPRYIVEWINDTRPGNPAPKPGEPPAILYRITSIGFGPNQDVQVMMQSTFAK